MEYLYFLELSVEKLIKILLVIVNDLLYVKCSDQFCKFNHIFVKSSKQVWISKPKSETIHKYFEFEFWIERFLE